MTQVLGLGLGTQIFGLDLVLVLKRLGLTSQTLLNYWEKPT